MTKTKLKKKVSNVVTKKSLLTGVETDPKIKNIDTLKVGMRTITPNMARFILNKNNKHNRNLSIPVVKRYANDMKHGNWKDTGESIQFDKKGGLLNGQHRLFSVILNGKPQRFAVCSGIDKGAFDCIDNGKTRTDADALKLHGYEHPTVTGTLTRQILSFETFNNNVDSRYTPTNRFTKMDILDKLKKDPTITQFVGRYEDSPVVTHAVGSFCYWMLSQADQSKAEEYLDQILLGNNLKPNSVCKNIYDKLIFNKTSKTSGNRMSKTEVIGNIVLGWRVFMGWNKRSNNQIKWNAKSKFPSHTK